MTDETTTKLTPFDNGPLKVEGPFVILDGEGKPYPSTGKPAAFLCRCGKSANAPFCDGAHAREGFESCARAPSDAS